MEWHSGNDGGFGERENGKGNINFDGCAEIRSSGTPEDWKGGVFAWADTEFEMSGACDGGGEGRVNNS